MAVSVSLRGSLVPRLVALACLLTAETTIAAPPIADDGGDNRATVAHRNPLARQANTEPRDRSRDQASPAGAPGTESQNLATLPRPAKLSAAPEVPKNLQSVRSDEATTVLGQKVRGSDGKDILGPIIDVLVDGDGKPRAAIIDFGGFLGVGSRKIAVDWQLLKFTPANHDAPILLALDRAQIQAAPEYKEQTQPTEVVGPPPATPAPADAGSQAN